MGSVVTSLDPQTNVESGGAGARFMRLCRNVFDVDLRSLAALRIGMGVMLIVDQVSRARHLEAHYTDLGVAPRALVLDQFGVGCYLSVHWWLSGSVAATAALFVVTALVGLGLAVGWRTKIMNVACWYLQASLLTRLPLLQNSGDRTLLLMLLWSLFLPLGARWSLDSARHPQRRPGSDTYVSVASFAILMQVCLIYWVSIVLKLHAPMWREGTAVAFALTRDAYATGLAGWLLKFESLLPLLTLLTLAWEFGGPFLAFIPGWKWGRLVAVVGFWGMHLAFGLCMNLGTFWVISCMAWIVFLPTPFWDTILKGSTTRAGPELRPRRWQDLLAGAAFALVLLLNIRTIPELRRLIPGPVARVGHALRLRQDWGMFTHEKEATSGWFIVQGVLAGGDEHDLLPGGGPLSWDPPEVTTRRYVTARWAQFLHWYRILNESPYWEPYSQHLCRRWNAEHEGPQRLETVSIWWMGKHTSIFGDVEISRTLLHEHACGNPAGG